MTLEELKKLAPELKPEIRLCPQEIEVSVGTRMAEARAALGQFNNSCERPGMQVSGVCKRIPYEVADEHYGKHRGVYTYLLERT